jgi:hypothetical protein
MKSVHDTQGQLIGTFDGEYIYNKSGKHILRIDGDEVYDTSIPCKYVGDFTSEGITDLSGIITFTFS